MIIIANSGGRVSISDRYDKKFFESFIDKNAMKILGTALVTQNQRWTLNKMRKISLGE